MKTRLRLLGTLLVTAAIVACTGDPQPGSPDAAAEAAANEAQERGPNNGILLTDGDFVVELAIFETGVPPEYRAWSCHRRPSHTHRRLG